MTLADQMLLNILKLESVPREGLLMMAPRIQTSEAAVKSLLEKGLIEELFIRRKSVVKIDNKKPIRVIRVNKGRRLKKPPEKTEKREFTITTKYYNLTNKGHIYLANKYPAEYTAWYEAPADLKKRRSVIDRTLGESLCASMATTAGASLLCKGRVASEEYLAASNSVKFINTTTVRAICSGVEPASNDYDRLRFSGVILNKNKSIALYTNVTPGMKWKKAEAESDAKAIMLFKRLLNSQYGYDYYSPHSYAGDAALLVKNAHHFNQIINDTVRIRYGTKNEPGIAIEGAKKRDKRFGKPFSMSFFPTTNEGVRLLQMYLADSTTTCICFHKYVNSKYKVLENDRFSFKYRSNQTVYYAEPFLSMFELSNCGTQIHKNPQLCTGAICFDFMEDYLRAIFGPNAGIGTVSFKEFEEKYYFEIFGKEKEKKGNQERKRGKTDEVVSIQEENEDDFWDELESFPAMEVRHEEQQSQEWEEYFDEDELF